MVSPDAPLGTDADVRVALVHASAQVLSVEHSWASRETIAMADRFLQDELRPYTGDVEVPENDDEPDDIDRDGEWPDGP